MKFPSGAQLAAVCFGTVLVVEVIGAAKLKSYYDLLGIKKSATEKEIKRAFRKLAVLYHPDKNKDPDAEKTFVEIAKAYEVLSDTEERKKYDMLGREQYEGGAARGGAGQRNEGGFKGFNFDDFFKDFDTSFKTFRTGHESQHHKAHRHGHSFNFGDDFWEDLNGDFGLFEDLFGGSFGHDQHGFGGGFHFDPFESTHKNIHARHNSVWESHQQKVKDMKQGHHKMQSQNIHTSGGRTCRTVTQRVGNSVTTYTECS